MISPPLTTKKDLRSLRAGVFTVGYQNGFIRHIKYGEIEVLRSIYMALRDQNWFTYEHTIENEVIEEHDDHFDIRYDCYYELTGMKIFTWHVQISGTSDGTVAFEINGEALADVLKNRAGICVLHPLKYTSGYPCELLQENGSQIKKVFPITISAENPFKDLTGFRWRCHYDWYALHFEGDVFETEDQRNWSDASYKTFCTPLSKPFPVKLSRGEKVWQKVTFTSESDLLFAAAENEVPVEIVALQKKSSLPKIGLATSTEMPELSDEIIDALQKLNLHHLRIDVEPSAPKWTEKFSRECAQAKRLDVPLEIALHIRHFEELEIFYAKVKQLQPAIERILLLALDKPATDASLIDQIESLRDRFPFVQIGAGTDYNFRELNCNRFDARAVDFISYGVDPQQHATDDLTIIENIATTADSVRSARDLFGESKTVQISALTLKRRLNASATESSGRFLSNDQKSDPRQKTPFAAAFTLGSIKTLAQADANAVTFYQTVGNQGVISADGDKYPLYDVLHEVLTGGTDVIHTTSSQPLLADALLLENGATLKLMLVNYTSIFQKVLFRKDLYVLKPYEIRGIDIH